MTRDEAIATVQAYFRSLGVNSPGLNEHNFGGASIRDGQIYFEYQPTEQVLKCSALIYKFQVEPKRGILEQFREEERTTNTGGGVLDYETENRGLYLSRSYAETISDQQFARDLDQLIDAGRVWSEEVLDRVGSKIFHPEELAASS